VEKELAASRGSLVGFVPAAVGGLVGAVAGALAWAAIAILSGYEIGYVAVLVGWLAGHGVRIGARGARGRGLQTVAVALSLLGLLLAKYFLVAHYTVVAFAEEGTQISYLDPRLALMFPFVLPDLMSPFDILWVLLAVGAAMRGPAPHAVTVEG
jgi:hypothetical protein